MHFQTGSPNSLGRYGRKPVPAKPSNPPPATLPDSWPSSKPTESTNAATTKKRAADAASLAASERDPKRPRLNEPTPVPDPRPVLSKTTTAQAHLAFMSPAERLRAAREAIGVREPGTGRPWQRRSVASPSREFLRRQRVAPGGGYKPRVPSLLSGAVRDGEFEYRPHKRAEEAWEQRLAVRLAREAGREAWEEYQDSLVEDEEEEDEDEEAEDEDEDEEEEEEDEDGEEKEEGGEGGKEKEEARPVVEVSVEVEADGEEEVDDEEYDGEWEVVKLGGGGA
ncbi:hypothetical protein EDC01DRAFT_630604 [Geopyxis carbonaria]|nr:hypothetical protein EDC01DRAFT_630604 [Geopyxis carbonaria]